MQMYIKITNRHDATNFQLSVIQASVSLFERDLQKDARRKCLYSISVVPRSKVYLTRSTVDTAIALNQ